MTLLILHAILISCNNKLIVFNYNLKADWLSKADCLYLKKRKTLFIELRTLVSTLSGSCTCAFVVWTHIFIFSSEMWSCGLVHSHDHCHHVFAVEDGCSQNISGLVVCEFVNKWAEVLVLKCRKDAFRAHRRVIAHPENIINTTLGFIMPYLWKPNTLNTSLEKFI